MRTFKRTASGESYALNKGNRIDYTAQVFTHPIKCQPDALARK